ncbi:hypothetical protein ACHAWF_004659 [Thalassiosira exigua]
MSSSVCDRLTDEIIAEWRIISAITTQDYHSEEGRKKADHIKLVSKKEEELELIIESQRVEAIVRDYDEFFPPTLEDCPICLETIRITHPACVGSYPCCGKFTCLSCHKDNGDRGNGGFTNCPLCRTHLPVDVNAMHKMVKKHAEEGRVWAQINLGCSYATGCSGFPVDKREAFRLLKKIVEEQEDSFFMYSDALCKLSILYRDGIEGVLEPSLSMEMKYLQNAADRGHTYAQFYLANKYVEFGGEGDLAKALIYFTTAYSHGLIGGPSRMLGLFYHLGLGGLGKSLYCAKHYLLKAAKEGSDSTYHNLSLAILELCSNQYGTIPPQEETDIPRMKQSVTLAIDQNVIGITGHSCIPSVMYWLRRSVLENEEYRSRSAELIRELEKECKEACANCRKKTNSFTQPLKACVRCKAVWYCGREVSDYSTHIVSLKIVG